MYNIGIRAHVRTQRRFLKCKTTQQRIITRVPWTGGGVETGGCVLRSGGAGEGGGGGGGGGGECRVAVVAASAAVCFKIKSQTFCGAWFIL